MNICPCCSGLPYETCCKPFHNGELPPTPLALMRSRYSAYALSLPSYIQKTTHPKSPYIEKNLSQWTEGILAFCRNTQFVRLEILSFGDNWVHFIAHLTQAGKPIQLNEKSHFEKIHSQWFYHSPLTQTVA